MMRNRFISVCLCAAVLAVAGMHADAALSADKLKEALDCSADASMVFSKASADSWKTCTSAPKAPANVDGTVALVGGSCLRCDIGNGQKGTYGEYSFNLRTVSYFTVTVEGSGTLSFNYRASLDSWSRDSVLYVFEGETVETEDGEGKIGTTFCSDLWLEKNTQGGPVYDLSAEEFWESGQLELDMSTGYEHTVYFAVFGPAKVDDEGNVIEESDADKQDPDDSEELDVILENSLYLDNLTWTPDEQNITSIKTSMYSMDKFSTSAFLGATIGTQNRVQDEEFRFYYTLDGSEPTVDSDCYDPNNDEQEPIIFEEPCILKVKPYYIQTQKLLEETKTLTVLSSAVSPVVTESEKVAVELKSGLNGVNATITYYIPGDMKKRAVVQGTEVSVGTYERSALLEKRLYAYAGSENKASLPSAIDFRAAETPETPSEIWVDGTKVATLEEAKDFCEYVELKFDESQTVTVLPERLTESGTITWVAASHTEDTTCYLAGETRSVTCTLQAGGEGAVTREALSTDASGRTYDGWRLYAFPGRIAAEDAQTLLAALKPYVYSTANRCLEQAQAADLDDAATTAYWIYLPQVVLPEGGLTYHYYLRKSGLKMPSEQFVPVQADWLWDGRMMIQPSSDQPGDAECAGWKE